jgi:hypothetical protein
MSTINRVIAIAGAGVLALCVLDGQALAAGFAFKNDLRPIQPVIVQGASVSDGMVRRGQPLLIFPGRVGFDLRLEPGVRVITIHDASQPTRVLYRGQLDFQGQDMFFSIQFDNFGNIRLVPMPLMAMP